jgi:uncharacterized lipoprotein YajG
MKHLITLSLVLFTTICFSQNNGLIVGNLMDGEMNESPLMYASVSIKGTDIQTTTDLSGLFLFENLKDGGYTLVCSFAGYESKELKLTIANGQPAEINTTLNASSISLNDFAALGITTQDEREDKSVSVLN